MLYFLLSYVSKFIFTLETYLFLKIKEADFI